MIENAEEFKACISTNIKHSFRANKRDFGLLMVVSYRGFSRLSLAVKKVSSN
jgi:hypothetical protein